MNFNHYATVADMPPLFMSTLDIERLEMLADNLPASAGGVKEPLMEELSRASILRPEEIPDDVVTMNSVVRFKVDDRELCMTLVYPRDAVDSENHISVVTPVGAALIGLRRGAVIDWPRPGGGNLRIEVLDVLYQPERAGDYHR